MTDPVGAHYKLQAKDAFVALERLATTTTAEGKRVVPGGRRAAFDQPFASLTLIFSDALLFLLLWTAATLLQSSWERSHISTSEALAIVPSLAVWVGLRALLGLYPGYGLDAPEELRRQTHAVFTASAIIALFAMALQLGGVHMGGELPRTLPVVLLLGVLLLAPLVRHYLKQGMANVGLWGKPVVILGSGETGAQVVRLLKEEWELGFNPVAVFDNRLIPEEGHLEGVPYLGTLSDGMQLAEDHRIDTAIFAMPHIRRHHLARFVNWASLSFQRVMIIPNLGGVTNSAVTARNLAGTLSVEIKYNLLNPWTLRFKRSIDIVATLAGGLLILPLIVVLCLLVRLESGRGVFYNAQRMGKHGQPFACVKFRTMVPNAEEILQKMLEEDVEMRKEYMEYHKLSDDPRVTRIGRFLRATSLDELPQLWNVLRGEMSLVGPRPYLPRESEDIGVTQSEILRVPPGITGPWQVAGRNHTSFSERVQMDVHYVRDWSVWLDLVLLARTFTTVLRRGEAY